eukprot:2859123-Pleurochrysis_carterae.AAC.1
MKGAGCTSAVGSGSPRRWWYRPCIQKGGPTHTHAHAQVGHKAFARLPCLYCASGCVGCVARL